MIRRLSLILVGVAAACGTLPQTTSDGGLDATIDVVDDIGVDVHDDVLADAAPDAPLDASFDAIKDATKPKLDAPYVDYDAATSPWVDIVSGGAFNSVAVDGNANVLIGGSVNSTFYLRELDSTGAELWSKEVGNGNVAAVTFDPTGDMIAAAYVAEALDLGGGAIGPGGVVVKYDANGTFAWEYGPFFNTTFVSVKTRSNGNVLLYGLLNGSDDYGSGKITSNGRIVVLVELKSNKAFVSAKTWAGTDQAPLVMTVDPWDDVYLAGRFTGTIDFGGGALSGPNPGSGSYNNFVVELDSSSNYLYQMDTKTNSNNDSLTGLSVDWDGNIFLSGVASNGINYGGATLTCGGGALGMLDQFFNYKWSKCYQNVAGGVGVDPAKGFGYGCSYSNSASFGVGTLPQYNGACLARFDTTGKALASFGSGSVQNYFGSAFTTSFLTWPDFVIIGTCSGDLNFPSGLVSCPPNTAAFVARLQP